MSYRFSARPFLSHMLRRLIPFFCGLSVFLGLLAGGIFLERQPIYRDTLRLHIRAASDSETDQRLKLLVRDRLTAETALLTVDAGTREEAEYRIKKALPTLSAAAAETLRENGCTLPVSLSLENESFNTRSYETAAGTITLPAGRYPALSVMIGKGTGHNWWCVLYPSLCLPAAEKEETEAALAHYTDEERRLVTGGITVRFWTAELVTWLRSLMGETVYRR